MVAIDHGGRVSAITIGERVVVAGLYAHNAGSQCNITGARRAIGIHIHEYRAAHLPAVRAEVADGEVGHDDLTARGGGRPALMNDMIAGRQAYRAGRMPMRAHANASSPTSGLIE